MCKTNEKETIMSHGFFQTVNTFINYYGHKMYTQYYFYYAYKLYMYFIYVSCLKKKMSELIIIIYGSGHTKLGQRCYMIRQN